MADGGAVVDIRGVSARWRVLAALALLGPVLVVVAADPVAAAGNEKPYLAAETREPLAGESVAFHGSVPTHTAPRPFVVQHRKKPGRPWVTDRRIRSEQFGRFSFTVEAPRKVGVSLQTRIVAVRGQFSGGYFPRSPSPVVEMTTAPQKTFLGGPRTGQVGVEYNLGAEVRPVRPGRILDLQEHRGDSWTTVDSTRQGTGPDVAFQVPVEGTETDRYRLRARPFAGSRGSSTNSILVSGRDQSPESPLTARAGVSAGETQACDLLPSGVARCWGVNHDRRLGSDTTSRTHGRVPVEVQGDHLWSVVDAGSTSTCGVRTDGELWCWGEIATDRDNDGSTDRPEADDPLMQLGSERDWRSVEVGTGDACGIRANGTLWCWSHWRHYHAEGPSFSSTPSQVGWYDDWTQAAVGRGHLCGIRANGSLWCRGANSSGQLGVGSTESSTNLVQVGQDRWRAVAASDTGTCGVQLDGSLWCWGSTTSWGFDSHWVTPQRIGDGSQWVAVSVSDTTTCALASDGAVWCRDEGTGIDRALSPKPSSAQFTDLSVAESVGCGTDLDGVTHCWGDGRFTGDFAPQYVDAYPRRLGIPGGWDSWASNGGDWLACALRDDRGMYCWGRINLDVGTGSVEDGTYMPPSFFGSTFAQASSGHDHVCGVSLSRELYCWGDNFYGEMGIGTQIPNRGGPTRVGDADDWVEVVAAEDRTCGRRADGSLWCWGLDVFTPSPGPGAYPRSPVPRQVGDEEQTWIDVDLRADHTTCAVRSDHTLWCGGYNWFGQLGIGSKDEQGDPPRPLTQVGDDDDWASVHVGDRSTCGIRVDESLWCWGLNQDGQLGTGTAGEDELTPMKVVGSLRWGDVTPAGRHTCGVTTDGRGWCWGSNLLGGLGDDTFEDHATPSEVTGNHRWRQLMITEHDGTCGVDTGGLLWCWGAHGGHYGLTTGRTDLAPVGYREKQ